MDEALKYRIVEKIIKTQDKTLLNEVKNLLGLSEKDFWNDLPEEVKFAVNISKEELDQGKGISHEQVLAEVKAKYLKK